MPSRHIGSLNALRTFEAVARHQSFTAGAEELRVTQSAASHQIRKLEEDLGVSLLDRRGPGVTLTPAGEVLSLAVHDGLTTISRAVDLVSASQIKRPLGLHVRAHFALKWLAPRLVRLWEKHPGLDIRLQHSNDPADFSDRSIDLAIEWLHCDEVKAGSCLLLEGNLTPACHPSLLEQPDIKPAALADYAWLHETNEASWRAWAEAAGVPNIRGSRNHYFDDTNVRQEAATQGEGFALVCPALVKEELAAGSLVCPFEVHLSSYAYYVVTPPHKIESPAARMAKRWLLDEAEQSSEGGSEAMNRDHGA